MPSNPSRILAVKLADLGDLLLCEPALRSLREGHPEAEIDLLTTPHSLGVLEMFDLDLNPVLFNKAMFDEPLRAIRRPAAMSAALRLAARLRRQRYDLVAIFHHLTTSAGARKYQALAAATGAPEVAGLDNGRGGFLTTRVIDDGFGAQHEVDYMLAVARAAGGADVTPEPRVRVMATNSSLELPDRYVVLCPATGVFSKAREWPAERFAELATRLEADGLAVVIAGGPDAVEAALVIQKATAGAIDLTGRTGLPELASVLRGAVAVVSGDSFPGHLAAAVGAPVTGIFGPSNDAAWRPYRTVREDEIDNPQAAPVRGIVVREDLPCAPCLYTGYRLGRREGCPARTCLQRVTVDRVYRAIHQVTGAAN